MGPKRVAFFASLFLTVAGPAIAQDATISQATQAEITSAQALELLKEGNARFVKGEMRERNFQAQILQSASGQFPFASIVACIDSRAAPEIVFDQGIGKLFVARVAGNFVNDDILGSLEFATRLSGSKLVVILGHTECGAIKGACDGAQLGLLTATLANINPAVEAVQGDYSPRNSSNGEFVHAVAVENVRQSMQLLRERSLVLRDMIDSGDIAVVGAMYDIHTGAVTFLD